LIRTVLKKIHVGAGAAVIAGMMSTTALAADTVKLGFIEPLSGPVAAVGRDLLEQFEYIVGEINAAGGVLGGKKIEIVQLDNAMNAEKSIQQLKKAIDSDIKFVTQGVGSNHALNIIKFLAKHNKRNPDKRVVYLNNSAVTTAFTNELCSFWHFRFDANVDMKVAALTARMGQDSSIKKVYMVNQNYAYGKSFQAAARRMLPERAKGASLVGDELIVPFGKVKDFTPYIAKIQAAGADTILTGNWGPDLARFVTAAASSGLKAQFYTIYGGIPSSINAIGAENYKKVKLKQVTEYHDNDPKNSKAARASADGFLAATQKTWYADRYRWLLHMFAAALNKAGSDDPVAVAKALEGMTYDGPNGQVVMRASDHQIQLPMVISTATTNYNAQPFTYAGKSMGIGWKTDAWIPRDTVGLPTTCKMKRP